MKISGYAPILTKSENETAFYAVTIGRVQNQTIVHRPLGIEDYQILYTDNGKGNAFINGENHEMKKGRILFLSPHTAHEYSKLGKNNWSTRYITFNGCGCAILKSYPSMCFDALKFDFDFWYNSISTQKNTVNNAERTSITLYEMLLQLRQFMKPSKIYLKRRHVLTRAMYYLSEEKDPQLSVISKELGMSESHFCRVFKSYTGYRPIEYMNLIKMQKAKELLKNTDMTINDISNTVGYYSHSYFSKIFKQSFKISPTEYRKKYN